MTAPVEHAESCASLHAGSFAYGLESSAGDELCSCGAEENWLPVPGFDGYDVSDQGRVKSWRGREAPKFLSNAPSSKGYARVLLYSGRKETRVSRMVHQLVLEAFVGRRPSGFVARHLDGDKTNNYRSNLTWGTHTENNTDTVLHGHHTGATKTECLRGHPYTPENTGLMAGARFCRACRRLGGVKRDGVCQRGHILTPENTYTRPDGHGRMCRECMRLRERRAKP